MLSTIYFIAYSKLYGALFPCYLPVYSVEDTQTKRTGASEKVPASWQGNVLVVVWEMGAWGNEAEIHLQEIWFTQACGIPSRQNEQSNLPTFLDHSRKQHLLSSRQEGLTACAEEPPWCTAGWGGCQHLLKGNIVFQHLESEPSEEIKSTDTSPPSGEQRSTAIISKRVWNTEMTFCFVWNLERQSASFSKPGGRSKIFLKNGTNISCKRTLPYSFKQREMWRAPSLTPIIHITKKKRFFSVLC